MTLIGLEQEVETPLAMIGATSVEALKAANLNVLKEDAAIRNVIGNATWNELQQVKRIGNVTWNEPNTCVVTQWLLLEVMSTLSVSSTNGVQCRLIYQRTSRMVFRFWCDNSSHRQHDASSLCHDASSLCHDASSLCHVYVPLCTPFHVSLVHV